MKPIAFTVPYPPSANRYWRVWRGHAVLSNEARAYKRSVCLALKASGVKPLDGPLRLVLRVYRPRKAGDLSNRIKVLEDALQDAAFEDDAQIVSIVADRFDDKARPRVEVEISEVAREGA